MEIGTLPKIKAPRAAELCRAFEPEQAGRALLAEDPTPAQFLAGLVDAGQFMDALRFLAQALPKREATWWACLCVRSTLDPAAPPTDTAALAAAEKWVYEPTEDHRRLALQAGEATGYQTPAGWVAAAAGWSGGSLLPADKPVVAPAEDLTGKAVAGAVLLAAVAREAKDIPGYHQQFLESGLDIANGGTGQPQGSA